MKRTTYGTLLDPDPWRTLVKAQAQALKAELGRQGTRLRHGHALDLCAHLAGYESWNHYSAALNRGTGVVNDLTSLRSRREGTPAEEDLRQVMQAAGAKVLREALGSVGGRLQLFTVRGTALNLFALGEHLAPMNEDVILDDLFGARPHLKVVVQDRELLPLLSQLCVAEGPGLLARLQGEERETWAYLAGATPFTALAFALAYAVLPPVPEAEGGTPGPQTSFKQRLQWPDQHGPGAAASSSQPTPGTLERWVRLWKTGEGLEERLTQLLGRLPAGYPTGRSLPAQTVPWAAHVAFRDALEAHALHARQAPRRAMEWIDQLPEATLMALLSDVRREVEAAADRRATDLPSSACAEIRAALAAGLTLDEVTEEVQGLLEDARRSTAASTST